MPKPLTIPEDIEIVDGPHGPRFRGCARSLIELAEQLRTLGDAAPGTRFRIGRITVVVAEEELGPLENLVQLPAHVWNIVASKFIEVATGRENSPFDFGDCGYLRPRPDVDIGVDLDGDPLQDW